MNPTRRNLLASSGVLVSVAALGGAPPVLAEQDTPPRRAKTAGGADADTTRDPFAQLAHQRAQQDPLIDYIKNVRAYGAIGNGTADDTAAIQAAVNDATSPYTGTRKGTVYFPVGVYKITASITYPIGSSKYINFMGAPGAEIQGNFNGYLFERISDGGITYTGVTEFHNLIMGNSYATPGKNSGCIFIGNCIGAKVTSCYLSVVGGFAVRCGAQSLTVDSCSIVGQDIAGSVGVLAGNGTVVLNCDMVGLGQGIRHQNLGLAVVGGRYETNLCGIMLGQDEDGNNIGSNAVHIAGVSMESNIDHIVCNAVGRVTVTGIAFTSYEPLCATGVKILAGYEILVENCAFSGGYLTACIYVDNIVGASNLIFRNISASNNISPSQPAWIIPTNCPSFYWDNTNFGRTRTATIAGGAITAIGPMMVVDTEGGAASDDLDTINVSVKLYADGLVMTLRAANSARTVVVKDGTNLKLAGDCSLDNEEDTITLHYVSALAKWLELSRSNNGAR
jgi:hypothetical protein